MHGGINSAKAATENDDSFLARLASYTNDHLNSFRNEAVDGSIEEPRRCRQDHCADGSSSFVSKSFDCVALVEPGWVRSLSISSRAALNSLTARPIPWASSGSFFAPNRSKTMRRTTTMSGPTRLSMLAIIGVISVFV